MHGTRALFTTKVLSICFGMIALAGMIRFALTPSSVRIFCDQRLPLDAQNAIEQIVKQSPIRMRGVSGLCMELQQEYPSVHSVAISYKGSARAHVFVQAEKPWTLITVEMKSSTSQFVVCDSGKVIEKKYFNEVLLDGLPLITVVNKELDANITRCARTIRRTLFNDFSLTWVSAIELRVMCKHAPLVILADDITVHEQERFADVMRIFEAEKDTYAHGMKADIRLKDQIICSPL